MKNRTKDLAIIAMYSALLVAVQVALGFVAGVELVSVCLITFSVVFGGKRGAIVAVIFSLLRCIIWGIYPNVLVVYLIYFPLLSIVSALCGKIKGGVIFPVIVIVSGVMTALFTLLDDVISPLIMGFNAKAWSVYFYASLPTMATHIISVVVSVAILFLPMMKLFLKLKIRFFQE